MSHDETEREMRDLKWQDEKADAMRDVSFDRLEAIIRDRSTWLWRAEAGNLADLLLDVVKAASDFEAASHDYPEQTNFWVSDQKAFLHGQCALADALTALRAAQDKLP